MTGTIRIGISNGQVPGNKSTFPPQYRLSTRLHYYGTLFSTIEVNSCFYKTPQQSTYEKWAADVPENFQFTLKLSRDITHAKKLRFELSCMEKFLTSAKGLRSKKGCLLIQFPGKITLEQYSEVENILQQIRLEDPHNEWRIAVEFRHNSWYVAETSELLNEFGAAMVIHDHAKGGNSSMITDAGFLYLRLHGPAGNYRDSYSAASLDSKAGTIKEFSALGKDVYVYFNNTAGDAFENAKYLQSILNRV